MQSNAFSLYETDYAKTSGMEKSMDRVVKFLIENTNLCLANETMDDIFSNRVRTTTPISHIYNHAIESKTRGLFTGIYPYAGKNLINVPDLLTFPALTIDLASIPHRDALRNFAMYNNKIILNLAGIVRMEGVGDRAFVSDMGEIQNTIARGLLTRSYWLSMNKAGWLTPSLCKFITKTYSMVISDVIQRNYGLNSTEQITIAIFLAAYMIKRLQSMPRGIPNPAYLFDFLTKDKKFINDVTGENAKRFEGEFTLTDMCEAIRQNGPKRMEHFSIHDFYQQCEDLCSRDISNIIALEYPPYWTYHILLDQSNYSSRMTPILKRYRIDKEIMKFSQDLNTSRTFIQDIEDAM